MNRKKKIKETLKKKAKKANAKLHRPSKNKPRYIAKADRAKTDQQALIAQTEDNTDVIEIADS
ncbi:DUF2986 domain-containing protein [Endozoicomonas sp. G2_1]|uniref:DUF2986 domain-containing protein n=1 Tax=Endozoicomonas sp. G2_1 TaxID=2821091 RepID=UPI001ADBBFE8|nr:DUF2986 domain-containing protein [Endozoicomonas sp. G2_1]MBO9491673.1 DUF2986 domain-containing protein [Endozoicomonas sp. G2_1]